MRTIYKISPASAWREAERQGVFRGSEHDRRDGFIHFSTASQVAETARKHYFGQTGLFLIAVDADALGDALRWETSRNDELFPHLYGELDLAAVTEVLDLCARADGGHDVQKFHGVEVGAALEHDRAGRDLPVWQGCRRVQTGEVFLMNWQVRDSLDGRYFGPLPASSVIGWATPLYADEDGLVVSEQPLF